MKVYGTLVIPDIISERGEELFLKQCVPTDGELLSIDNYESFLESRRAQLAECLNGFISRD